MAQHYGARDPLSGITSSGLVLFIHPSLKQCYNGGSTITDLVNGFSYTASNMSLDQSGNFVFNGSNSNIQTGQSMIDNGTSYTLSSSSDDYTLEAWIYVETSSGTTTNADSIIGSSGSYGVGMQVAINGSVPRINFGARNTSNFYGNNFTYNSWKHVVWSHDTGVGSTVYMNGSQDITSTGSSYQISGTSSDWGTIGIGYSSPRVTGYFDGKMGPIRMYNRAITSTEVAKNFNASKARYGL